MWSLSISAGQQKEGGQCDFASPRMNGAVENSSVAVHC